MWVVVRRDTAHGAHGDETVILMDRYMTTVLYNSAIFAISDSKGSLGRDGEDSVEVKRMVSDKHVWDKPQSDLVYLLQKCCSPTFHW